MINKAVCMWQCSNVLITQLSCSNSLSLFCIYFWDQQSGQDKLSQAPLPSSSSDCTCSQEPNSSFFHRLFHSESTFSAFSKMVGPSLASYWPGTILPSNRSAVSRSELQLTWFRRSYFDSQHCQPPRPAWAVVCKESESEQPVLFSYNILPIIWPSGRAGGDRLG